MPTRYFGEKHRHVCPFFVNGPEPAGLVAMRNRTLTQHVRGSGKGLFGSHRRKTYFMVLELHACSPFYDRLSSGIHFIGWRRCPRAPARCSSTTNFDA